MDNYQISIFDIIEDTYRDNLEVNDPIVLHEQSDCKNKQTGKQYPSLMIAKMFRPGSNSNLF